MTMNDSTKLVRVDDVQKKLGDTAALNGVSLEIGAGESVAVVGPAGCGKSTLVSLVAGLDRPTSGRVLIQGRDLGELTKAELEVFRRRHIGMISQPADLVDYLSALDNVALAAQLPGTSVRHVRARALGLLDELGVADRRDTYPAALSGEERQRVAVARALMNRPALLLADEPTGTVDSRSGERLMDLLIDLNRSGHTLLIATRDPRLATRCATRLIEFADGRVAPEGERR